MLFPQIVNFVRICSMLSHMTARDFDNICWSPMLLQCWYVRVNKFLRRSPVPNRWISSSQIVKLGCNQFESMLYLSTGSEKYQIYFRFGDTSNFFNLQPRVIKCELYVCMYAWMYVGMYVCTYVRTYVHAYIHACMHTHTHTRTHTHTHTHIYIHIYIYIPDSGTIAPNILFPLM